MNNAELDALAKGMSEKQRRAVMLAEPGHWQNSKEIGATGGTLSSLCWYWPKDADPISPCLSLFSRGYEDRPLRYCYRLTEDGLRLRSHLRAQEASAGGESV